ncbi:hypothetical protein L9F63_022586 [Diploptera punctata]|uniref:CRAL-TRIO domain-containing protein n=1 Tax=Diploptera punctata TaxID=6984 RepID=A0AAD8EAU2_DIPPU|nr:hypothetical protein L9F63_022586 [Diploptera punctata]
MKEDALELPDQQLIENIWSEFGLNEQRIKEAVEILNEWLEQQPHLPRETDDARLERWLLRCKNSIEKTKQVLDLYYTLRTISPEFMTGWDTDSDWFHGIFRVMYVYPVRKLTPEGDRITIMGLFGTDGSEYEPIDLGKICLMGLEVRTCEDYWRSDILVFDFTNITIQHVSKITLTIIKKLGILILKGYKYRLKSAHLINVPPFAQIIINMVKSILKPKLIERIHFHGHDLTDMYTYIPKQLLPIEYGGEGGSQAENNVRWKLKLQSYREWFREHEKLKSDETKRPGKILRSDDIFGFDGSFRKLELD